MQLLNTPVIVVNLDLSDKFLPKELKLQQLCVHICAVQNLYFLQVRLKPLSSAIFCFKCHHVKECILYI